MYKLFLSLLIALVASTVQAQTTCTGKLTGPAFTPQQATAVCNYLGGVTFSTSSGVTMSANTQGVNLVPYVATMAATPVAGTNDIRRLTVVPTAAANTAACLPALPTPGAKYEVFNSNTVNAIRVKPCGTPGVNGGAAGTYIGVAALAKAECDATTATNYNCVVSAAWPTPAGP